MLFPFGRQFYRSALYQIELLMLEKNSWNHLTLCQHIISNRLFKNKVTFNLFAIKSYF